MKRGSGGEAAAAAAPPPFTRVQVPMDGAAPRDVLPEEYIRSDASHRRDRPRIYRNSDRYWGIARTQTAEAPDDVMLVLRLAGPRREMANGAHRYTEFLVFECAGVTGLEVFVAMCDPTGNVLHNTTRDGDAPPLEFGITVDTTRFARSMQQRPPRMRASAEPVLRLEEYTEVPRRRVLQALRQRVERWSRPAIVRALGDDRDQMAYVSSQEEIAYLMADRALEFKETMDTGLPSATLGILNDDAYMRAAGPPAAAAAAGALTYPQWAHRTIVAATRHTSVEDATDAAGIRAWSKPAAVVRRRRVSRAKDTAGTAAAAWRASTGFRRRLAPPEDDDDDDGDRIGGGGAASVRANPAVYAPYERVGASIALDTFLGVKCTETKETLKFGARAAWAAYQCIYVRGVGRAAKLVGVRAIHPLLLTPSVLHPALEMHWFLDDPRADDPDYDAFDTGAFDHVVAHAVAFMAYNWACHARAAAADDGGDGRMLYIHSDPRPLSADGDRVGVTLDAHIAALMYQIHPPSWQDNHARIRFVPDTYRECVPRAQQQGPPVAAAAAVRIPESPPQPPSPELPQPLSPQSPLHTPTDAQPPELVQMADDDGDDDDDDDLRMAQSDGPRTQGLPTQQPARANDEEEEDEEAEEDDEEDDRMRSQSPPL